MALRRVHQCNRKPRKVNMENDSDKSEGVITSPPATCSAHPWKNMGFATMKLKEARKEAKRRYERKYYADTELRRLDGKKRGNNWRARQKASAPNDEVSGGAPLTNRKQNPATPRHSLD